MLKVYPGDIEQVAPLKHGSKWKYVTDHPMKAIPSENYFQPAHLFFEPGCEIEVMVRLERGFAKASFHVVRSQPDGVVVEMGPGGWSKYGTAPKMEAAEDTPTYVEGKAAWKGTKERWVVAAGGRVVVRGLDKQTALAVARGEQPVPKEKAA